MPVRNDRFDYRDPVDGSDPATGWHGLTPLASLPRVVAPAGGWLYNSNDAPWAAAGPASPRAADFPRYMDQAGPNARGLHAVALLKDAHGLTPEALRDLAYDRYQPGFAILVGHLLKDWDALPATDPRRATLTPQIALLRAWDTRWSATSTAQSLAVFWGDQLQRVHGAAAKAARVNILDLLATGIPLDARLAALQTASDMLTRDFGRWQVPWGEINRFQRLDDRIAPHFDDAKPSTPVPFASALWGSLASFGARPYSNTKRYYGNVGNSFVAIVEFGPQVRAWAVMAGGQSGDPASPHFADQVTRYAAGDLRPIHFTPADIAAHAKRSYRPGD